MSRGPAIALLASRVRLEEKQIMDALRQRSVTVTQIDTRALRIGVDCVRPDPVAVLVREIGQTRAEYAARALERSGAVVVNSTAAIEACGDKWRTTEQLRQRGLPVPRAMLALDPDSALEALEELGYPAVIKPLVGSWGRLVGLLPDPDAAATVLQYVAALPSPRARLVYLQEFVCAERDLRVVVVGEEALGVTSRRGAGWRANVATGASSTACELTAAIAALAVEAADAVGAEIAGVDLLQEGSGRLTVLEVNHRVEFAGFQAAHGTAVDVAGRIADYLLRRIPA